MYQEKSRAQLLCGNATVMKNHLEVAKVSYMLAADIEGDQAKYMDGRIWVDNDTLGLYQIYNLVLENGRQMGFAPTRLADPYLHSYDVSIYQGEEISGFIH